MQLYLRWGCGDRELAELGACWARVGCRVSLCWAIRSVECVRAMGTRWARSAFGAAFLAPFQRLFLAKGTEELQRHRTPGLWPRRASACPPPGTGLHVLVRLRASGGDCFLMSSVQQFRGWNAAHQAAENYRIVGHPAPGRPGAPDGLAGARAQGPRDRGSRLTTVS